MIWDKFMKWMHYVVILILLNFAWLLGVFFGVIILGVVPSTAALMTIYRQKKLFDLATSYREIMIIFVETYYRVLKENIAFIGISTFFFILAMVEWFLVRNVEILRAALQIPLTILLCYLVIVLCNSSYLMASEGKLSGSQFKFLVLSPLIFWSTSVGVLTSIVAVVFVASYQPLVGLVSNSLVIYLAARYLKSEYQKYGWEVV